MKHVLAAAIFGAVLASWANAEVVRWINAAGGEWGVGANWDRGTPPGVGDTALLDLASAYTVTGLNGHQVAVLKVRHGPLSLVNEGTFTTGTMDVNGELRLEGGTYRLIAGFASVSTIEGSFQATDTVLVNDDGVNPRMQHMRVWGTTRLERSSIAAGSIDLRGNVEGGTYSGYSGGFGPGTFQGMRIVGSENGLRITGPAGVNNSFVGGAGSLAVSVSGHVDFLTTEVSGLRYLEAASVLIGAGCVVNDGWQSPIYLQDSSSIAFAEDTRCDSGVALGVGARVRIDAAAAGPPWLSHGGGVDRFEFVLDGAASPAFTPRLSKFTGSVLSGTCAVEVRNPNRLRVGDVVELLASADPYTGAFVSQDVPVLGGGRTMVIEAETHRVVARVGAGGSPCWGPDFDGDGVDGTDADIEAFFACLAGDCCALCGSVDFDSDGDTATDADIEAFFRVLAGGAC